MVSLIKNRSIQDYLAWSYEYLHQCHHFRKEVVVLKLDIEKAFDLLEHHVIITIISQLVFLDKWIDLILNSVASSILLNGIPGKNFSICLIKLSGV